MSGFKSYRTQQRVTSVKNYNVFTEWFACIRWYYSRSELLSCVCEWSTDWKNKVNELLFEEKWVSNDWLIFRENRQDSFICGSYSTGYYLWNINSTSTMYSFYSFFLSCFLKQTNLYHYGKNLRFVGPKIFFPFTATKYTTFRTELT